MVFPTDKSARTALKRPITVGTDFVRRTGLSDIYSLTPGSIVTVSVDKRGGLYAGAVVYTTDSFLSRFSVWTAVSVDDTADVADAAIPANATGVAFVCSAVTDTVVPRAGAAVAIKDANSASSLTAHNRFRVYSGDHVVPAFTAVPWPGGANPLFWYDFTTIEGLFQDTSLLTPVTASAQEIMGAANAGSVVGGSVSSQGKLLGAAGPDYITGGLNGLSYANFDNSLLESLDGDLITFDWADTAKAMMCVFEYASGAATQTVMHDTTGGGNLMKVSANSTPTFTNVSIDSGGATFDPPVAGVSFSAIGLIDAIQRETRMTHDTPNIGAGTLLAHSNKAISVGVDNGGLNAWGGRIYEVAAWGNGSVPTLDDLEAYVTNKYTLAWV